MLVDKLQSVKDRYLAVSEQIIKPEVINDQKKYKELTKEYSNLQPIVEKFDEYQTIEKNIKECLALRETESGEMLELIEQDLEDSKLKLEALEEEIKIMLLPKDENDEKNVIMEIRGGA
ncbi:MAG: PCRF domain-containing protein, partial [Clostridia bacterium]|nr:PCRF domain-containing protein [Clostridia bacterium]